MGIQDPEIVELVNQIEALEQRLYAHPLHKVRHITLRKNIKFQMQCSIQRKMIVSSKELYSSLPSFYLWFNVVSGCASD